MNLAISDNQAGISSGVMLKTLLDGIAYETSSDIDKIGISGLSNDSRKVVPHDLFFAVPGSNYDGSKFIPEAASLGAAAVITESDIKGVDSIPIIKCSDIRRAMSKIAARFYGNPARNLCMVGITGTNGKTTITYLVGHILRAFGKNYGRIGTVEYFTGKRAVQAINTTPDSLVIEKYLAEMRDNNLDGCAMEVSSHGLMQYRCDDIEYDAAIFTNLTQDHLDYHKDLENYFMAKTKLFTDYLKADGLVVLNANDPYSYRIQQMCSAKVIFYAVNINSHKTETADLVITDNGYRDNHRNFTAEYRGQKVISSMPYLGKFNLANAAAAIAVAVGLGYDFVQAVKAMENAPQVPGRVEKVIGGQPFEVIIDYAHTPDALENLLTGVDTDGRKILVFGCGGDRDKTKRPIMGQVAAKYADVVFVTSDNPRSEDPNRIIREIVKGIPDNIKYTVIEKREEAIGQALLAAMPGDLVIIAGKGHEDYQVVGNTRYYFSDQKAVIGHLKKMGYAGN